MQSAKRLIASSVATMFQGSSTAPVRSVGLAKPIRRRISATDSSVMRPRSRLSSSAIGPPLGLLLRYMYYRANRTCKAARQPAEVCGTRPAWRETGVSDTCVYEGYETLRVVRRGKIVTVSFNRPEVKNATNPRMHQEL